MDEPIKPRSYACTMMAAAPEVLTVESPNRKSSRHGPTTIESQDRILLQRRREDERMGGLTLGELARIANRPHRGSD